MKLHELDYTDNKKYTDEHGCKYIMIDGCLRDYEDGEAILITKGIMNRDFKEIKPLTGWERVADGEPYTVILGNGELKTFINRYDPMDEKYFKQCNSFSIREKAEEELKEELLYRTIKKFRDENDEYVDWMNLQKEGFCINKRLSRNGFIITSWMTCRDLHTIYFTKRDLAERCLNEIVLPFIEENKMF